MATLEEQFNTRINGFMDETGMAPTTLGLLAVGDPNLLREIARGRSVSLRTADRAMAFMDRYERTAGGAGAPPARPPRARPAARPRRTRRSEAMRERPGNKRTEPPIRLLRIAEVVARTGLGRSTIYEWSADGRFPAPVRLPGACRAGSRPKWTSGSTSGWRGAGDERRGERHATELQRRRANEDERSDGRTTDDRTSGDAGPVPPAAGGAGPHGPVPEHDLRAAGRRAVSPAGPAGRARGRLDRVGDRPVDPRADRRGPERRRRRGARNPNRGGAGMRTLSKTMRTAVRAAALLLLMPGVLLAQGTSPWVDAVNELQTQFTGPIARGLSLIAIVVGGLMFAFGEGGSKRTLAGIIFGIGMAVGAVNFLGWLF